MLPSRTLTDTGSVVTTASVLADHLLPETSFCQTVLAQWISDTEDCCNQAGGSLCPFGLVV